MQCPAGGWPSACEVVKGCGGDVAPHSGWCHCVGVWWKGGVTSMRLCEMFVDFRWSVKFSLRMGILEEPDGLVFLLV